MIKIGGVPHCSIDDKHIEVSTAYKNIFQSMGEEAANKTIVWVYAELPDVRLRP